MNQNQKTLNADAMFDLARHGPPTEWAADHHFQVPGSENRNIRIRAKKSVEPEHHENYLETI